MSEKEKCIALYKNLAVTLHNRALWFFKNAFGVKPKSTTQSYLRAFLAGKNVPLNKIMWADSKYQYVDLDTMKSIIKYDWTDEKKYVSEVFDCDDFAFTFKAHLHERFHLNNVGMARSIKITDADTGEDKGYHRANVFFAEDNGELKLYFFEPQTDRFVEITDYREPIKLTGWNNQLNLLDF